MRRDELALLNREAGRKRFALIPSKSTFSGTSERVPSEGATMLSLDFRNLLRIRPAAGVIMSSTRQHNACYAPWSAFTGSNSFCQQEASNDQPGVDEIPPRMAEYEKEKILHAFDIAIAQELLEL